MKYFLIALTIFLLISAYAVYLALNKKSQLEKYKLLSEGMSTDKMLAIMGKGYSRNEENRETVYTWKAETKNKNIGVRKVVVTTKYDKVTKIQVY